jgi:hypothetical protein
MVPGENLRNIIVLNDLHHSCVGFCIRVSGQESPQLNNEKRLIDVVLPKMCHPAIFGPFYSCLWAGISVTPYLSDGCLYSCSASRLPIPPKAPRTVTVAPDFGRKFALDLRLRAGYPCLWAGYPCLWAGISAFSGGVSVSLGRNIRVSGQEYPCLWAGISVSLGRNFSLSPYGVRVDFRNILNLREL